MFKIIRIILAIIVLALAVYSLITKNFELMPYMMFFLGASMLLTGLVDFQKDRKALGGYISIIAAIFIFYVSLQGFLFN